MDPGLEPTLWVEVGARCQSQSAGDGKPQHGVSGLERVSFDFRCHELAAPHA